MSLSPSAVKSLREYVYSRYRNRSKVTNQRYYSIYESKDDDSDDDVENEDDSYSGQAPYHFVPTSPKSGFADDFSSPRDYEDNISGLITPVVSVSKSFTQSLFRKTINEQEISKIATDRSQHIIATTNISTEFVKPCSYGSPMSNKSRVHISESAKYDDRPLPEGVVVLVSPNISKERHLRQIKSESNFLDLISTSASTMRKESLLSCSKDVDNADCRRPIPSHTENCSLYKLICRQMKKLYRNARTRNSKQSICLASIVIAHRRALRSVESAALGLHCVILFLIVILSSFMIFDNRQDEYIAAHFISIM